MDQLNAPDDADAPQALLARADWLRDARRWAQAAEVYATFLERRPDDWGIMVQRGHCLKEAGRVADALEVYAAAEALAPEDADLALQIGHALKLLGRFEEACDAYDRAAMRDPAGTIGKTEAAALRQRLRGTDAPPADPFAPAAAPAWPLIAAAAPWPIPAPLAAASPAPPRHAPEAWPLAELTPPTPAVPRDTPPAAAARHGGTAAQLVFDVTDLLLYFRHRRSPTGIQRVQLGITMPMLSETGGTPVTLAALDQKSLHWRVVAPEHYRRLVELSATGADPAEAAWRAAVAASDAALASAAPVAFAPGAALVNLGNSFGFSEHFRALAPLIRQHDLRWIPFLHDCIPLLVPEHCTTAMVRDYARWFSGFAAHAHGFLANSANTRRDARRLLGAMLPGLQLPSEVIRLDADPLQGAPPPDPRALHGLRGFRPGTPFVLFVGTIESRKNHLLAFSAWLTLLRRHGPDAIPMLVCVGQAGWHAEAALNLLAAAPELADRVLLLDEVSDRQLAALYAGCLFTLYNSHYEGWGLPVTESLAHGKVALIPEHSALPEAGGTAALYFTPGSEPDLVAKLEQMLLDPGFRAARQAAVTGVALRSWPALARQTREAVASLVAAPSPHPSGRVALPLGTRIALCANTALRPSGTLAIAEALREGGGWYGAEEWGVWARGGSAVSLRLPLDEQQEGAALRLYLELRAPPGPLTLEVRVALAGGATLATHRLSLAPDEACCLLLPLGMLPPGGMPGGAAIEVELGSTGGALPAPGAPDSVGIGVRGLMLCREDDLAARLGFLESQALRVLPAR